VVGTNVDTLALWRLTSSAECNIRRRMATKPHLNDLGRHTAVSRVLSALLLVFVIYGTTIEAAHRHGRILNSHSTATAASTNSDNGSVGKGASSCAECLICQLHQHFSTSLVSVRLKHSPPSRISETYQPETHRVSTRAVATQSSRGPPLTS
jgi:hypothetical protein